MEQKGSNLEYNSLMSDETERRGFRSVARREIQPTLRSFPYPPEFTPQGDFGIDLAEGLLREIFSYARSGDVNLEHFGLIMGHLSYDSVRRIKWVDLNYLIDTPPGIRSGAVGVEVDAEQIARMSDVADVIKTFQNFEGEVQAGWWHSHPNLGIFFSGVDKDNQRTIYKNNWQIGLVVDPIRNQWGMFRGRNSEPFQPFVIPANLYNIEGSKVFPYKSAAFEVPPRFSVKARRTR